MPRAKTLSNLIQTASKSSVTQIQANPSHITLFCSQKQGQSLLNALPDVKPVEDLDKLPKLKMKIAKTHKKLEASAREAYKLGLTANLIRGQDKFMVLNSMLYGEDKSQQAHKQAQETVHRLSNHFNKYPRMQQKLTTSINAFPVVSITSPQTLNNKWILDDNDPISEQILTHSYHLLINPTILHASHPTSQYQQCISFPFMEFMIPRYNRLLIHYYNENYKSQFAFVQGFVSRVIQHQCDHLEGRTLVDWRINHGAMTMNQSVVEYFPKASAVVEDYAKTLKGVFKEFPQIVELRQEYVIDQRKIDKLLSEILRANSLTNKKQQRQQQLLADKNQHGRSACRSTDKKILQQQTYNSRFSINKQPTLQQLPFQDDYVVRIVRHFKKQFAKFDQKIQLGLISTQDISKNKQSTIQAKQASLNQYKQQEYSKLIKVKYLNMEQAGMDQKLSKSQERKAKRQKRSQGDYVLSDEEAEKALAKHKKGNKKRK